MYTTAQEVDNVIRGSCRKFSAKITINENDITDIKSVKLSRGSISEDAISIGNTVSANAEVIMKKVAYKLEGQECRLSFLINGVEIPMGNFTITKAVTTDNLTTITMSDKLSTEAEKAYASELVFPAKDTDVLKEICESMGIEFIAEDEALTITDKPEGYTKREVIGFVAAKHGKNAVINREGNLELKWFENVEYEINKDFIQSPELQDGEIEVNSLTVSTSDDTTYSEGSGITEIVISNPLMNKEDVSSAYGCIKGFLYKPANITMLLGDPRLDVWDTITLEGYNIPCMKIDLEFDGGIKTTIQSVGKTETEQSYDYKGPVTKQMERYYAELVLINKAMVNKLDAYEASITYATVTNLQAVAAEVTGKLDVNELEASVAALGYLKADEAALEYATIKELDAAKADIDEVNSLITTTNTLIFGSATGGTIQTEFSNSVIAQLGDAQIESAMIKEIVADKITGLDLNTTKFKVHSEDGMSYWSDNTICMYDGVLGTPRIQLGKDGSGDYNMYIWNSAGKLMFDALGLTENGVSRQIIRDDVVKDDANIAASKLDIDSLFSVINEDSSNTLKSSKILINDEGQTLDVSFKTLTTLVDNLQTIQTSQGTEISVIQGQISSKIWKQDIESAVSTIDIGGVNLLPETDETTIHEAEIPESNYVDCIAEKITLVENNNEYTLSFDAKAGEDGVKIICYFYDPENTTSAESSTGQTSTDADGKIVVTLGTEWQRYWIKWKQNDTTRTTKNLLIGRIYSTVGTAGTKCYFKALKFETGNMPTDWSPAPSDINEQIETVNNTLTTKYSTLEQSLSEFKVTVGETYATQETVTNLNTNLITNYSTTTDMNSAIELSANAITTSVCATMLATVGYTGKNLVKVTAENTEINGITFTIEDGVITANGTATGTTVLNVGTYNFEQRKYTLTGCPENGGSETYKLDALKSGATYKADYGKGTTYNPTESEVGEYRIRIVIYAGVVADNLVFKPMLRYAEITDDSFEIYRDSVETSITATQSSIDQLADSIIIKTETTGKVASIILSVNGEERDGGVIDMSGLVTFSDLSTSGSTTICGDNITTGIIKSTNYAEEYGQTTKGTKIDLSNGSIYAVNFTLTAAGKVIATEGTFTGTVNASAGTITGDLTVTGALVGTNGWNYTGSFRNGTMYWNYLTTSGEQTGWLGPGKATLLDTGEEVVGVAFVGNSGYTSMEYNNSSVSNSVSQVLLRDYIYIKSITNVTIKPESGRIYLSGDISTAGNSIHMYRGKLVLEDYADGTQDIICADETTASKDIQFYIGSVKVASLTSASVLNVSEIVNSGWFRINSYNGNFWLKNEYGLGSIQLVTEQYVAVRNNSGSYVPIKASSFDVNSLEEFKQDIKILQDDEALQILNNTDIYSYKLKAEVEKGKETTKYGCVIGSKYNTPKEFLNYEENALQLSNMVGIAYKIIKNHEKRIQELENQLAVESALMQSLLQANSL